MRMNYSEYMSHMIETFPIGTPITTDMVARTIAKEIGVSIEEIKGIVNLNLKRLADNKAIERIQKGVYYKPQMTAFGKTKPPIDRIITETCIKQDGQNIGYIGGETLLNSLGLTTLVPKSKVIVTNKHRVKTPAESHIILKKPVTEITEKNAKYLQMIDVVAMLDTAFIDVENPREILRQVIEQYTLDQLILITIAKKYYPQKTLLKLLDIILEDEDETTQG